MADDDSEDEEPAIVLGEGVEVEGAPLARVSARLMWGIEKSEIKRREGDTTIRTPEGPRELQDILAAVDHTYFGTRQEFEAAVRGVIGSGPVPTPEEPSADEGTDEEADEEGDEAEPEADAEPDEAEDAEEDGEVADEDEAGAADDEDAAAGDAEAADEADREEEGEAAESDAEVDESAEEYADEETADEENADDEDAEAADEEDGT